MAVNTTYHSATSTDYRDLLSDLTALISGNQVNTVAVNAGGTGYAVDDKITLSGGTSIVAATFIVTSVSSGVVTGLSVHNAGSYSTTPGTTAIATTGGTGTGLTVDLTYQVPWSIERTLIQAGVVSATPVAGGTGYVVSDVLTVSGGTGTAATLTVSSVSSGAVTGVTVTTNGSYTAVPTNPVSVTGGTGSGATFNLVTDGESGEDQYLIKGIGSGSDEIFCGIRTFTNSGAGANSWEIAGMTGHSLTGTWTTQPNITPGRHETTNDGGAYIPLDDDTITYWINVTGRRIVAAFKVSTAYASMYLGFVDPMGTVSELPYPLAVFGNTPRSDTAFNSGRAALSGILNPTAKRITSTVIDDGPAFVRLGSGAWKSIQNWAESESSTTTFSIRTGGTVVPPGRPNRDGDTTDDTSWLTEDFTWEDFARPGGATPTFNLTVTEDSGGDFPPLWPPTIILADGINKMAYGQLSGVKFLSTFDSGINVEDKVTDQNGVEYLVFPEYNHTEPIQRMALEIRT